MIKVRYNALPLDGNLQNQFLNTEKNNTAEEYVKALEHYITGKRCSFHPYRVQEIVVSTDSVRKFSVTKNDFCCDTFSQSIDLDLKK
jgi:hypothetical protein